MDIHKSQFNYICSGGNDGVAVLFDSNSSKVVCAMENPQDKTKVNSVQFTQEGILLTRANGAAEYWTLDILARSSSLKAQFQGHQGIKAQVHPLNPYSIFGTSSTSWGMYNIETGSKLCEIDLGDGYELNDITVHPDGLMMATGCKNGTIQLWDIRQQRVAANMENHKTPVTSLNFSEKGIHLASASTEDNVALLWNLKKIGKAQPQKMVHKQGGVVRSLTFDPYGAYIATACDTNLCFFEMANPDTCLFELPAHSEAINDLSFAMDGSCIATASEDRFMKIFAQ